MYHYAVIGYMLWRYSYVFEYTYYAFSYANTARHILFDKKDGKIESDEWILIEPKEPDVIIEEIELPIV